MLLVCVWKSASSMQRIVLLSWSLLTYKCFSNKILWTKILLINFIAQLDSIFQYIISQYNMNNRNDNLCHPMWESPLGTWNTKKKNLSFHLSMILRLMWLVKLNFMSQIAILLYICYGQRWSELLNKIIKGHFSL